ncbi:MAG: hypothetical protein AAF125_22345, partial [Chloroflexota bacterium]
VFATQALDFISLRQDDDVYQQMILNAQFEHNDIVRSLADQHDVFLIDFATILPENTDFWLGDRIHLAVAGLQIQGEIMAEALAESDLIPTP